MTAVDASAVVAGDGRFVVHDLSPSAASAYWTPPGAVVAAQQPAAVGGHPAGSGASSSSSFVDDESTSYEDIAYSGYGGPSSAVALQQAVSAGANCDYGGLYHQQHLHQPYGNGGGSYYDGYHHLTAGYDEKAPPYDNNNAADARDMNSLAVAYPGADPYGQPPALVQQVRFTVRLFHPPRAPLAIGARLPFGGELVPVRACVPVRMAYITP